MKDPTPAPMFACLYPGLCDVARARGYALTLHGTLTSDMDMVAIPWTDQAGDPEELVAALMRHIGALTHEGMLKRDLGESMAKTAAGIAKAEDERLGREVDERGWTIKPHGRRAINLHLNCGVKIDLSILPRHL